MAAVTTLEQVEQLLPRLTPDELARLLHRVADAVAHAHPGIESDPQVCGGEPRVAGTRIPVWVLAQARRLGQSDADLRAAYPTLSGEQFRAAHAYAAAHPDRMDADIRTNEEA